MGVVELRIYLDNCCFNRPFDDQTFDRIHIESEAILTILELCEQGNHEVVGSEVLEIEMDQSINFVKKEKVKSLYKTVLARIDYSEDILKRSKEIRSYTGIQAFDSMHIASAEKGNIDVFLTTDDKLIKGCKKMEFQLRIMNPVNWLMEVLDNE